MKRYSIACFLVCALSAGVGCGPKPLPPYDYSKEPDPRTGEYEFVLGVADSVNINVWKHPELSTQGSIRPDGTITMPLIGDLRAVGKTPSQLKEEIKPRLGQYIKLEGIEITIAVTGIASYRFTVSGEVTRSGLFESDRYVTVAEAIALAGGLSRFAKADRILILRTNPTTGEIRKIPIDYNFILNGERPDMNIVLLTGDTLLVP